MTTTTPLKPTTLILGSGPRLGSSIASKFSSLGYNIAVVSRRGTNALTPSGELSLSADFSDPSSIAGVFDAVESHFGTAPSVVVYNAGTLSSPPDKSSVLSIPWENVKRDFDTNTVSAYAAAQEAVKRWESMEGGGEKTFIYTGNALHEIGAPVGFWMTLGMGKGASAAWVRLADLMYRDKGYRFFFADERKEDGTADGNIDGEAHGEFYAELATRKTDIPWNATFVKGKGYVYFDPKDVSVEKILERNKPAIEAWLKG